ncbi:dihydrodiol dehydrogenase [Streptomyces europaeiscabiei]|jgi:hypothetical protein|uniref:dihydrodiol dehydrogenase n=1 Tax=Streptomyces europaeiscabiei TaxID=146819 RepID=UPI0038F7D8B0
MTTTQDESTGPTIRIANEFAEAIVRRVEHANGSRLRITAPKAGTEALIDAVVLEALAGVPAEELTAILVATVPGNAPYLLEQQLRSSPSVE